MGLNTCCRGLEVPEMAKPSILIIDDSALFRDFLANKLKASHLVVIVANNGADGAKKISHHHGLLPQ